MSHHVLASIATNVMVSWMYEAPNIATAHELAAADLQWAPPSFVRYTKVRACAPRWAVTSMTPVEVEKKVGSEYVVCARSYPLTTTGRDSCQFFASVVMA